MGFVQSGNKGNEVKKLQENLITMGYDCGRCGADGDFGQDTYNAVKKFQSDYGLTQDGVAGPQTNQAIANALKTGSNGVPNYIMHKINSISTGKDIEWNNGVPKDIMDKINIGQTPNPDPISIARSFLKGVGEGVLNGAKGLIESIAHPIDTANGLLLLARYTKPGTEEQYLFSKMMAKTLIEVWDDFSESNADKKAEMIGKAVGEVIFMVAGTKGVTAATKALKVGVETGKFSEVISKFRKGTLTAYDIEKIALKNPLPNMENASINPKKLTEYALNLEHPVGGNKAKVFESTLGYNKSNADDLIKQVYSKLQESESVIGKLDQYGQRYTVDMNITGPNGNSKIVRTGWIIKPGSTVPELTTIYVK